MWRKRDNIATLIRSRADITTLQYWTRSALSLECLAPGEADCYLMETNKAFFLKEAGDVMVPIFLFFSVSRVRDRNLP